MRLRKRLPIALAGLLAYTPLVIGHSGKYHARLDQRSLDPLVGLAERSVSRDANTELEKRAASGAGCGPAAGNAVCDAGLCCSEQGVCGTGTAFCGGPACQLSFGPACDGNQAAAGKDTSGVPRPTFGSVPYGVDISHCTVNGKVALTFDDGPYIYTTELLDLLKRNGVRATFFLVGNNAGKGNINNAASGYRPIIQRMISDGHQVGSHTWSHQDLDAATPQQRRTQIINNEIALNDILGVIPTYFRPPYTRCGADCYNDLKGFGYHVTNYDIDTRDWENGGVNAKNTYQTILSQHSPASSAWISLAHDVQDFTVHQFAQFMIDTARQLKYDLVTVGECLGDPAVNWYRDPVTGGPRDARSASSPVPSPAPAPPAPPDQPVSSGAEAASLTTSQAAAPSPSSQGGTPSSTATLAKAPQPTVTPSAVPDANFGLNKTLSSTSSAPAVASTSSKGAALAPAAPLPAAMGQTNSLVGMLLGLIALGAML